jgi:c(7)-type cytochrome triheme protein
LRRPGRATVAGLVAAGLLSIVLGLAQVLFAGASPTAAAGAVGFDHLRHQSRVSMALEPEIPCSRCHGMDATGRGADADRGRPAHRACFGECHGPMPPPRRAGRRYAISADQRGYCVICHAPAALDAAEAGGRSALTVAYPPYDHDPDHGLALSHAAHQAPTRDRGDCTVCHIMPGAAGKRARGHDRCVDCHAAGPRSGAVGPADAPGMDQCQRCHVPAYGRRSGSFLVRGPVPVSATFSHVDHAARGAIDCRLCHDSVARSADTELSAPTMASCQTCHDGRAAFSVLGPQCRRCHTAPDAGTDPRPRLQARFDHDTHRVRLGGAPCARCHTLDVRGVPGPPAADHAPCSDAGCHRDEFSAFQPTICGACHVGTEPWRPLHFDRPFRPDTQFGVRFSHRAHLVDRAHRAASEGDPGCTDCHGRASRRGGMDVPGDHSACTGAGCHALEGVVEPGLSDCEACHVAGLREQRERARGQAQWSVRARFRHESHERAPGGDRQVACAECHRGAERATASHDMPTPAKQTCLTCHQGEHAFKVTGHGCVRCHGGARAALP